MQLLPRTVLEVLMMSSAWGFPRLYRSARIQDSAALAIPALMEAAVTIKENVDTVLKTVALETAL